MATICNKSQAIFTLLQKLSLPNSIVMGIELKSFIQSCQSKLKAFNDPLLFFARLFASILMELLQVLQDKVVLCHLQICSQIIFWHLA